MSKSFSFIMFLFASFVAGFLATSAILTADTPVGMPAVGTTINGGLGCFGKEEAKALAAAMSKGKEEGEAYLSRPDNTCGEAGDTFRVEVVGYVEKVGRYWVVEVKIQNSSRTGYVLITAQEAQKSGAPLDL